MTQEDYNIAFNDNDKWSNHTISNKSCMCTPDLLQLLVRRRVGHEQAVAVAHRHAAEDPAAADRGVHNGDDLVLESIFNSPISDTN